MHNLPTISNFTEGSLDFESMQFTFFEWNKKHNFRKWNSRETQSRTKTRRRNDFGNAKHQKPPWHYSLTITHERQTWLGPINRCRELVRVRALRRIDDAFGVFWMIRFPVNSPKGISKCFQSDSVDDLLTFKPATIRFITPRCTVRHWECTHSLRSSLTGREPIVLCLSDGGRCVRKRLSVDFIVVTVCWQLVRNRFVGRADLLGSVAWRLSRSVLDALGSKGVHGRAIFTSSCFWFRKYWWDSIDNLIGNSWILFE